MFMYQKMLSFPHKKYFPFIKNKRFIRFVIFSIENKHKIIYFGNIKKDKHDKNVF